MLMIGARCMQIAHLGGVLRNTAVRGNSLRRALLTGVESASQRQTRAARREERELAKLKKMATAHGLVTFEKEKLMRELGQSIAKRMIQRRGNKIYQMITFALPYFPRDILEEVLPDAFVIERTPQRTSWALASTPALSLTLAPLLVKSTYVCAGSSRAFRTKSERVIRVVGKIIPDLEISHEVSSTGVERCYVNGMYVLATEAGELHWPKDNNRRELEVSAEMQVELRQELLSEVLEMGNAGHPLSPAFWRQLGDETRAAAVEVELATSRRHQVKSRHVKSRRVRPSSLVQRASIAKYEVDQIVAEKMVANKKKVFLVQWAGYNPAWEPERITGGVGDPIQTWEPSHLLKDKEALAAWKVAQAAAAQRTN